MSAVDKETGDVTFTADKTPQEMRETVGTPTWCVITFAPGVFAKDEISIDVPPAFGSGHFSFGYIYNINDDKNACAVTDSDTTGVSWKLDLTVFGS